MRKVLSAGFGLLAIITLWCVCGGGVCAQSEPAEREKRLSVFDDVWRSVRDLYYDPTLHKLNWTALRDEYRPLAAATSSNRAFYTVMRRLLSRLGDSHTRIYAPDEPSDWQHQRYLTLGLTVREIEGRIAIAAVEPHSEAARVGVRTGDLLLGVNGQNPAALAARLEHEEIGASLSATTRFQAVARLLDGAHDEPLLLTFAGRDGREHSARLFRYERERAGRLLLRRAAGRVWVASFDIFTPNVSAEFARALRSKNLRAARGLVFDLRNNGGGEAEAMAEMISALLPDGESLGEFTDRANRTYLAPHTRGALLFSPEMLVRYAGPLVVLTSAKTASAAEIFVAALKERNRAHVIGAHTCGCVLGVRRHHNLPDGGTLDVSETNYLTARGQRLEGVGIAPDENVTVTLSDLRDRRDRTLERAIEWLEQQ